MSQIIPLYACKAIKDYVGIKIQLLLEKGIDITSSIAASIIGIIFFTVSFLLFFFFSTYALALFLADYLGKVYWGYLIISAIYLLSGIVFWYCRNIIVKKPISKILYKSIQKKLHNTSIE